MTPSSDDLIDQVRAYAMGKSSMPPPAEVLLHFLNLYDHRTEQLHAFRENQARLVAKAREVLRGPIMHTVMTDEDALRLAKKHGLPS